MIRGSRGVRAGGSRRRENGSALVEFAIVLPFLALIVFGTVDVGRVFRLQSRLANSAREGGVFAQFHPTSVDVGCDGAQNVTDRVLDEDADLSGLDGFSVQVLKKDGLTGGLAPYSGCRTTVTANVAPGDHVVVRVRASFSPLTPLVSSVIGSPVTVSGSHEVVVQG